LLVSLRQYAVDSVFCAGPMRHGPTGFDAPVHFHDVSAVERLERAALRETGEIRPT
jgi:hypothetical protein